MKKDNTNRVQVRFENGLETRYSATPLRKWILGISMPEFHD